MSLSGKIISEIGVHATAEKWFDLFANKLHHVQNLTDRVHGTKLHQGDDWHHTESVKHWTYTIDGKVTTCQESIESVDVENKTIIYKLFDGDIDKQFKVFKFIIQANDDKDKGTIIKGTIEYEKISDDVDPPFGYVKHLYKCAKDIDSYLLKA